jgi:DNA-binding MarR family transcriptional regulator
VPDAHSPQAEDTCQHAGRASSPLGRAGITRSRQDLQNGFLDALRRTASLMQLMGQVAADRIGINTTDLNCLNILSFTGSMTAGQLARATGLTTASITGVIDRLEQAGYARRERDPHDRRRVVIHLSPDTANRDVAPVIAPVFAAWQKIAASYTDVELELIAGFQRRAETAMCHQLALMRHPQPDT